MLCERHAWLSLFLTRDYAESTRKDDEILENNGKKISRRSFVLFVIGQRFPWEKWLGLFDDVETETRTSDAEIAQGSGS